MSSWLSLIFPSFSFFYFCLFSVTFSLTPCSVFLTFFHLSSMFLVFFIFFRSLTPRNLFPFFMNVQVSCDAQLCCLSPDVSKHLVPLPSGWSNQWFEPSILLCLIHTENKTLNLDFLPWIWIHYYLTKRRQVITQRHNVISQKTFTRITQQVLQHLNGLQSKLKENNCNFFCSQLWMFRLLLQSVVIVPFAIAVSCECSVCYCCQL